MLAALARRCAARSAVASAFWTTVSFRADRYNDSPETASRAFDVSRDGFVIAGGGGIVVLEELGHAKGAQ